MLIDLYMGNKLKNILADSNKKTVVSIENKHKRTSFDDSFGKKKMEIAAKFIGGEANSIALAKKLGSIL